MARRRWPRARIVVLATVVPVIVVAGLTLRLFVYPDVNTPQKADAIVVLGAKGADSLNEGLSLGEKGFAPTIALSMPAYQSFCARHRAPLPTERLVCFWPHPSTTQGEGRSIARLARVHHWHRIIVVMPTAQATRARLRIGRCYPGQVLEVGVSIPGFWAEAYRVVYEWGALAKALVLQPTC